MSKKIFFLWSTTLFCLSNLLLCSVEDDARIEVEVRLNFNESIRVEVTESNMKQEEDFNPFAENLNMQIPFAVEGLIMNGYTVSVRDRATSESSRLTLLNLDRDKQFTLGMEFIPDSDPTVRGRFTDDGHGINLFSDEQTKNEAEQLPMDESGEVFYSDILILAQTNS